MVFCKKERLLMSNYADSGLELTLIDGTKIDFYPAGLITGQDENYLPPFTDCDEVKDILESYASGLFSTPLTNRLYIHCYADYSLSIQTYNSNLPVLRSLFLPQSKFKYSAEISDLYIPVTRMSKPSSKGEISGSSLGISGKTETDSFLVREQRLAIREARKTLEKSVKDGEEVFQKGMDKFKEQLPSIKADFIDAGKKHLDSLSAFHQASQQRPFLQQVIESTSAQNIRWEQFQQNRPA